MERVRLPWIALLTCLLACVLCATVHAGDAKVDRGVRHFDFGSGPLEAGYVAVGLADRYDSSTGYGWVDTDHGTLLRDREAPDPLRRDYVFGRKPLNFKVDLPPGVISGLTDATETLKAVEGVAHTAFSNADIVRHAKLNHSPEVLGGVNPQESAAMLRHFFEQKRVQAGR